MYSYRINNLCRNFIRVTVKLQPKQNAILPSRYYAASDKKSEPSTFKLAMMGTAIGAAVGTAYSTYSQWHEKTDHMIHERKHPKVLSRLPKVKITKKVVNPKDDTDLDLVLFQFQTCPFCCKVRAFLDFLGLSYSIVEVDAVLRQDLKWSEYKKVPMLLAKQRDGKYVQLTDSSTIVSILSSYMLDKNQDIGELVKLYPNVSFFDDKGKKVYDILNKYFLMFGDKNKPSTSKEDQLSERQWRSWVDTHLVHLISPNVYRSWNESLETFEWFSDAGEWSIHFPKWERDLMVYVGAVAMWILSKRLKTRYGLDDDVRSHIYDALDKWTDSLEKKKTKFMGGKQPNLADLAVFGVLSSMEGCQAFKDCLQNTKIREWFYAVKDIVNKNKGTIIRETVIGDQNKISL
ncbi:prostaglandin E synthase 2 [Condylostylus longicornis]|uniref:prostaglandin E synthase 2 n=1 Tax=Condylostylus longicornis TaxID=2530218 RepID=UPI00244DEBA7|nr:prostaglandin E synthase 2 [Condylostylus longicornis]